MEWGVDDLLAFADDHLILSIIKGSLRRAIAFVRSWCRVSNIELNAEKFGILEIPPKELNWLWL